MIDTSKQYTYNGKPVRIYADGSDTTYKKLHCGVENHIGEWDITTCWESDLVETWQPTEGELVCLWSDGCNYYLVGKYAKATNGHSFRLSDGDTGASFKHCTKFTGTLPEAFKGL